VLSRIIGGCFYLVGALPIAFVLIGQNLFEPESLFGCNRVISDSWVVTYQELSTAPFTTERTDLLETECLAKALASLNSHCPHNTLALTGISSFARQPFYDGPWPQP